ncbi:hypothetical protein [Devosia sp. 1566]|uniref:hypothetical protein n=1 Tax=Devosia sp. 1566 TaxID=2499144 RepID=UPI000FD97593|nr:hypothetical protein [Devosia sp. 1566]
MDSEQISALYQLGGAAAVIIVGAFFGIQWVVRTVQAMKTSPSVKTEKTTIITGDTVAMDRLAGTIEASNTILTENNVLRREEHADRSMMRKALEENTEALERATAVLQDIRPEIRELTREIVRSGK